MKKVDLRLWIRRAGFCFGAAILGWQIISSIDLFRRNSVQLSFLWILIGFIAVIASIGLQMAAWQWIMKGLGVRLSYRQVFDVYLPSFLPRYIPGTIWGYLSRSEWLFQAFNIDHRLSGMGSLLEIIIGLLSNIIIIGMANYIDRSSIILFWVGVIVLCLAIYVILHLVGKLRIIGRQRFFQPFTSTLRSFSLPVWLFVIALFAGTWLLYGLGLGSVMRGMGEKFPVNALTDWIRISGLYSLSWLVGFLMVVAPAGLGFREVVMAFLITQAYPLDFQTGSAISVVMRLVILFSEVLWLLFVFILRRCSHGKGIHSISSNK